MEFTTSSKTILAIWPANPHASEAFKLDHNKAFIARSSEEPRRRKKRAQRDTTPKYDTPAQEQILLRTDVYPRDLTKGWCFGSNSSRCDVLLDRDNSRGVSGVHFEINHNWKSFAVLITNRSRNALEMFLPNQDRDQIQEGETRALLKAPCIIPLNVGLLRLMLEVPERKDSAAYDQNLREYYEKAITALPLLGQLDVQQRSNYTPAVKNHRYMEEKQLGRGSHAMVFSAIDGSTGDIVAIKYFYDSVPKENIAREVQILKRLNHDNIVPLIDYVPLSRTLVMEFAPHGTLAECDLITRPQLYRLATQMTSALAYLHDRGITHRDVKPANILIVSKKLQFDFKLADFSISSESRDLATFCGTHMYYAPEIKDRHYSEAIDIWSLGVLLVERWCEWYPDFVYNLFDTFLPDTLGNPTVVIEAKKKDLHAKVDWTDTQRSRWIEWVRSQLHGENDEPMSRLFLNMLQVEPRQRYSAMLCYQYLQYPNVRDIYKPQSISSGGVVEGSESRPSKRARYDATASEVAIIFRHHDGTMSATGLWHASSKRKWPLHAICCRYASRKSNGKTYVSFADGLDLARRLRLRESSLTLLHEQTLKQPRTIYLTSTAIIPIEELEVVPDGHKIVHILPSLSLINACNIMDCGNITRLERERFLKTHKIVKGQIIKTPKMQGTYIDYNEGLRLCSILNLPTDRVRLAIDEGWLGPVLAVRTGSNDTGASACTSESLGSGDESEFGDENDESYHSNESSHDERVDGLPRRDEHESSGLDEKNWLSSSRGRNTPPAEAGACTSGYSNGKNTQIDRTFPSLNYSPLYLQNSPLPIFEPDRRMQAAEWLPSEELSFGELGLIPEMVETEEGLDSASLQRGI